MTMRLLLVAEESAGLQVLRMLMESAHELVAVMAAPEFAAVRGATVWSLAAGLGIPTIAAANVAKPAFAKTLEKLRIDLVLNVHALYVMCEAVLRVPRLGAYNLHPGPLPQYAGLNAPSWALYYGATEYGVTLHKMAPGIDTGDIAYEAAFPIVDRDTAISVYSKCVRHGVPLISKLINALDKDPDSLPLTPQDLSKRRYLKRDVPNRGRLLWDQPAKGIVDLVRACDFGPFDSPWGHPECGLGDRRLKVVRAARTGQPSAAPPGTVVDRDARSVDVAAADELVRVSHVEIAAEVLAAPSVLTSGQRLIPLQQ